MLRQWEIPPHPYFSYLLYHAIISITECCHSHTYRFALCFHHWIQLKFNNPIIVEFSGCHSSTCVVSLVFQEHEWQQGDHGLSESEHMVCSSVSISPAHVIIIITTVSMTYHLQLSVQSFLMMSATVHCQQFFCRFIHSSVSSPIPGYPITPHPRPTEQAWCKRCEG